MAIIPEPPPDLTLRDQLSSMRSLLALSMVMTECGDQNHILDLAAASVPSLGRCRLQGAYLAGSGWQDIEGAGAGPQARADLETQFAVLSVAGGAVAVLGQAWAWAYPLRSLDDHLGYLVVGTEDEPPSAEQSILRLLAQQTGIAIANARQRTRQQTSTERLRTANSALNATVAALEYSTKIHERLTAAADAGEGPDGIAEVLHELTGYPVAVEDRHGNLRAWAGPGRPIPYPKETRAARAQLLRQARQDGPTPVRRSGRLMVPVGPHGEVLGVLALVDPDGTTSRQDQVALEHAGTVLALQLAHLHSLAEAELRLGRDLVEELVAGVDVETVLARAEALGYDLQRPHRMVVVAGAGPERDDGGLFNAVRRAVHETGIGSLLTARGGEVVVLSDADRPWAGFQTAVRRELGGDLCRVGVGGAYADPVRFTRSYHEARLAMKLQSVSGGGAQATEFDRLGVYRLLAEINEPASVERFVQEWLGALLDYDKGRQSDLVATLSRYLECGRNYQATTTALAIHRSTLKYRLQRIREISGHDLSDPDVYFNLQLAARAWSILRAVRAARY
jgi:sugar diacid utilization regulator